MSERGFVFQTENLLSPADAVATYLAAVTLRKPRTEQVALPDAYGRFLASDVVADDDYPNAPRSAMDGFAVNAADGATRLLVVGDITMGSTFSRRLNPGEAVRIPTGGVVPEGADAIVPIEDADVKGAYVRVREAAAVGENINPVACDMRKGNLILSTGARIGAPQLGVLATLGMARVDVFARPRFAVISSGDELVSVEQRPALGQIRDSNRYAVAGLLRALGCEVTHFPTISDEPGALEAAFRRALPIADGAVVTGGSSVGERDRTPDAIAALGAPGVVVHGLRVKPGKPTVLAAVGDQPVIGLPGNPTSAVVILQAVVAPIIARLCGGEAPMSTVSARLAASARSRPGWTWYVPVELKQEGGAWTAHPLPLRSSTVSLISKAAGFVTLPEAVEELRAESIVTVERFL